MACGHASLEKVVFFCWGSHHPNEKIPPYESGAAIKSEVRGAKPRLVITYILHLSLSTSQFPMKINRKLREISIKVVYYGPGYSGKTTNIEQLHQIVPEHLRSPLTSISNKGDRTLFFDYMQLSLGKIGGLTPRFNLYTVPGQPQYASTRKIVLRGADAVVFVADSGMARVKDNVLSWRQLQAQLGELNVRLDRFPLIMQFNKRDLLDALPLPLMCRMFNMSIQDKFYEAVALKNIGTRETLQAVVEDIFQRLKEARTQTQTKLR